MTKPFSYDAFFNRRGEPPKHIPDQAMKINPSQGWAYFEPEEFDRTSLTGLSVSINVALSQVDDAADCVVAFACKHRLLAGVAGPRYIAKAMAGGELELLTLYDTTSISSRKWRGLFHELEAELASKQIRKGKISAESNRVKESFYLATTRYADESGNVIPAGSVVNLCADPKFSPIILSNSAIASARRPFDDQRIMERQPGHFSPHDVNTMRHLNTVCAYTEICARKQSNVVSDIHIRIYPGENCDHLQRAFTVAGIPAFLYVNKEAGDFVGILQDDFKNVTEAAARKARSYYRLSIQEGFQTPLTDYEAVYPSGLDRTGVRRGYPVAIPAGP